MEIKKFDIWKSGKIRNHLYIVDAASDRYPQDQDLFIEATYTTKKEAINRCKKTTAKYAQVTMLTWTNDRYEASEEILFWKGGC